MHSPHVIPQCRAALGTFHFAENNLLIASSNLSPIFPPGTVTIYPWRVIPLSDHRADTTALVPHSVIGALPTGTLQVKGGASHRPLKGGQFSRGEHKVLFPQDFVLDAVDNDGGQHGFGAVAAAPPYLTIIAPYPKGCLLLWFKRGASTLLPGLATLKPQHRVTLSSLFWIPFQEGNVAKLDNRPWTSTLQGTELR